MIASYIPTVAVVKPAATPKPVSPAELPTTVATPAVAPKPRTPLVAATPETGTTEAVAVVAALYRPKNRCSSSANTCSRQ